MDTNLPLVTIYCDGACHPNPGHGGWAVLLQYGEAERFFGGNVSEDTTNNAMEIYAAIEGLKALKKPCQVTILSDSQYFVNCANEEWAINSNVELWDDYFEMAAPHLVTAKWIRGHSGIPENEKVNKRAEFEARKGYHRQKDVETE